MAAAIPADKRPVRRPDDAPTLARFLLDQLFEAGVDRIFGIPGDFILRLCQVIDEDPRIAFHTLSHEPGVGFAASGAARASIANPEAGGLGVACVTYGAGALNMVNPVAAAYAEKTPVLVLTGGPSREERESGILVHHQVKSFASQCRVFQEVTCYQAVLDDPREAAAQIRRAIDQCRLYSLPVYLEVPRDMVDAEIAVSPAREIAVPTNPEAVDEAAAEAAAKVASSRSPVLVVGVEVHRLRLTDAVVALAERLGVPVVSTFMGRGTFPDDHPQFAGVYLGPASPPGVQELVEDSDALLLLGALLSDTNMGIQITRKISPRDMVLAVNREVRIGHHRYDDVPLGDLVRRMADVALPDRGAPPHFDRRPFMCADDEPSAGPIRVASLVAELNRFLREHGEMPLVTDTGDCLFVSHQVDTQIVVASAYYATMGFGVPAALGFEAAGGRRPLVLVGDGAFQMTGAELIHALRWGLKPIVIVMNNASWEMLQSFLPTGYNTVADWKYAEMARLWGAAAWRVGTAGELREALEVARGGERAALIEVTLERGDISETLRTFTRSVGNTPPPPE